jgi:hypothetical protein
MKNSDKDDEKLDSPIIFFGSIGVAISCGASTAMKVGGINTILITLAGLTIGCVIGYFTKKSQEDNSN